MKLKYFAIILIFVLMVSAFYPDPQRVFAAGATISGKVVDENGNPLANVRVLTDGSGMIIVHTDGSGNYTLNSVAAGCLHLRADTPGRAFSNYWNYNVVDGGNYHVNFTLRPGGGSIQGRIVDDKGAGLAGITVQIWENTGLGSFGTDNGFYTITTSGADGGFTTSPTQDGGLPTGTVRVMATLNGTSGWNYNVPVWSGQVTTNVQVNIVAGTGSINGYVTDASNGGAKLSGVTVIADSGVVMSANTTDANGNYAILSLPQFGYNVLAFKAGYATAHRYDVEVEDNHLTPNINFSLTNQIGTITGNVSDENGNALANVGIVADTEQGSGFGNTATDSSGNYKLTNMAPMSYHVHAAFAGYARITKSAVVVNGQNTPNINFKLSKASRTISGRVTKDGQPAPYAGIYVNGSYDSSYSAYGGTTADNQGYYTITDLPPDPYDVHVSGVAGYPSEVLYEINAKTGDASGVDINLTKGLSTISGHVTDPGGNPMIGVTVQAFQNDSPGTYTSVTTDNNGNYTFSGLWGGLYTYYASMAGYNQVVKHWINVQPSGTTVVDFTMGQASAVYSVPNDLYVKVDAVHGTYRGIRVEVTAGNNVSWTANSSVPWLKLGNSGNVYQMSGLAGDSLMLRFCPDMVSGNGTFSTTVTISSPNAAAGQVAVSFEKVTTLFQVFLPFELH